MMTNSEIIAQFIMEIINGELSLMDTKKRIQEYESKYGTNFFADYDVEKKEKPWNSDYLNELKFKSMTGMTSKQFILHLAEVSEYVHAQEKSKNNKRKSFIATIVDTVKNNKKICIIAAIVAAGIVALIIWNLFLSKSNAAALTVISNQCALIESLKAQLVAKMIF